MDQEASHDSGLGDIQTAAAAAASALAPAGPHEYSRWSPSTASPVFPPLPARKPDEPIPAVHHRVHDRIIAWEANEYARAMRGTLMTVLDNTRR